MPRLSYNFANNGSFRRKLYHIVAVLLLLLHNASPFTIAVGGIQVTRKSLVLLAHKIPSKENIASGDDAKETAAESSEGGNISDGGVFADANEGTGRSHAITAKPTTKSVEPPRPTAQQLMAAMGTSPRRIALSVLSGAGIALAGNLFGVTSNLLNRLPEESVGNTGLDTYFPRGDYKRFNGRSYTLVIPKTWVADTSLELLKAQQRTAALDLTIPQQQRNSSFRSNLPDAAFGPAGNTRTSGGDINVSILVSKISATEAASLLSLLEKDASSFLQAFFGKGRTLERLSVRSPINTDTARSNILTELEYTVDRGETRPPLRAISVIGVSQDNDRSNDLITMTVVAPQASWLNDTPSSTKLRKIVSSFKLR